MRFPDVLQKSSNYFPIAYLGLLILYGMVGFTAPGYDDEFFNIAIIEKHSFGAIALVQGLDVHPPGSYFVNWVLFSLLGEWNLVRLVSSVFTAGLLIYGIESIRRRHGLSAGLAAFLLLGLNPAFLLWCTGLRWYALFTPILLWLCITPRIVNWWYWTKLFAGLLVLAYIGYAAIVLAPALLVLYWKNCSDTTKGKIKSVAIYGGIAALLYAHQLMIFVTVHLGNKESQVSSLWRSAMGFAIAQVGNQGVFPLSAGGILTAAGSIGLFALGSMPLLRRWRSDTYGLPYWIGVAGLVGSGLAGKFRNFVILSPLQGVWFSTLLQDGKDGKNRRMHATFLLLMAIGNAIGVFNVATHRNTTKNSWNLPVTEVMEKVAAAATDCKQDLLVLTHDQTLSYLLEKRNYRVLGPYSRTYRGTDLADRNYACLMVLKSFAGSIGDETMQRLYASLEAIRHGAIETSFAGVDSDYKFKRMLDTRYPEHQIEVALYRAVGDLGGLGVWSPQEIR